MTEACNGTPTAGSQLTLSEPLYSVTVQPHPGPTAKVVKLWVCGNPGGMEFATPDPALWIPFTRMSVEAC